MGEPENKAGGREASWRLLQYSQGRWGKWQCKGMREATPSGFILLFSHFLHHILEFCVWDQSRQKGEICISGDKEDTVQRVCESRGLVLEKKFPFLIYFDFLWGWKKSRNVDKSSKRSPFLRDGMNGEVYFLFTVELSCKCHPPLIVCKSKTMTKVIKKWNAFIIEKLLCK